MCETQICEFRQRIKPVCSWANKFSFHRTTGSEILFSFMRIKTWAVRWTVCRILSAVWSDSESWKNIDRLRNLDFVSKFYETKEFGSVNITKLVPFFMLLINYLKFKKLFVPGLSSAKLNYLF